MKIIADLDVPILCDSGKCTAAAYYVCTVKSSVPYARLYCPQHTAELLQEAAEMIGSDENLHEYIETEFLIKGAAINV